VPRSRLLRPEHSSHLSLYDVPPADAGGESCRKLMLLAWT
jgi:hypothetical protein